MSGVFQVDRELFENSIWNNITEFRLFFYILGNAVWKQEGVKKGDVEVKRGQYLRSYRNLSKDLMYLDNKAEKYHSISTIKRTIDKLVHDGRLETKETEYGTLFTVVNYELYQGFERFDKEDLEQSRNSRGTVAEQSRNNKKKDNKDNKVNRYIYSHLEQKWGVPISPSMVNDLDHLIKEYGEEKVKAGIEISAENNVRTMRYLTTVVRNGAKRREDANGKSRGFDEEAARLRSEGIGL